MLYKKIISLLLCATLVSSPLLANDTPAIAIATNDQELVQKAHMALDATINYFNSKIYAQKVLGYIGCGFLGLIGLTVTGAFLAAYFGSKGASKPVNKHVSVWPTLSDFKGRQPQEFLTIVQQIRNYDEMIRQGSNGIDHILFYGPPGTGKTKRAEAIANDLGAYLFKIEPGGFGSGYVGETARAIKATFDAVRKYKPKNFKPSDKPYAVIFLDEVDHIAGDRQKVNAFVSGGAYPENPINTLLTQVDPDNKENKGILVIAATNHKNMLDEGILSRFKNHVELALPSAADLKEICKKHATTKVAQHFSKATRYKKDARGNFDTEELINKTLLYTNNDFEDIDFHEATLEKFKCSSRDVTGLLDKARTRLAAKTLSSAQGPVDNLDNNADMVLFGTTRKPKVTQVIYDEVLVEFISQKAVLPQQRASGHTERSESKEDENPRTVTPLAPLLRTLLSSPECRVQ